MDKLFLSLCLLLCSMPVYAETCPNIEKVKAGQMQGWQAYDSDDDKPLSIRRLTHFKKQADKFLLAASVKSGIRCYYGDHTGAALEAYLAKPHLSPINKNNLWYQVSGSLDCAAGMDKCQFQKNGFEHSQLADNET